MSNKNIESKKVIVAGIKEKFEKASTVVLVDYRGLTVAEVTDLRNQLRKAGVDCEMHIYQNGKHGLSLSNEECFPQGAVNMRPECQNWIDMAARWLKELETSK